jgi:hypothetical protein
VSFVPTIFEDFLCSSSYPSGYPLCGRVLFFSAKTSLSFASFAPFAVSSFWPYRRTRRIQLPQVIPMRALRTAAKTARPIPIQNWPAFSQSTNRLRSKT